MASVTITCPVIWRNFLTASIDASGNPKCSAPDETLLVLMLKPLLFLELRHIHVFKLISKSKYCNELKIINYIIFIMMIIILCYRNYLAEIISQSNYL